ncbi:MAG: RNA polymerase sigma factor [Bacteroidales bacterium]
MKDTSIEVIYTMYYHTLFLYALSLTKSRADAEDLVSDTFVQALLSLPEDTNIKSWLFKVLRNKFVDFHRKRKKQVDEDKYPIHLIQDPQDIIKDFFIEEQKKWLYTKIYELPIREKEILLLQLIAHYTDEEIAKELDLSPANVRKNKTKNQRKTKTKSHRGGLQ